MAIQRSAVPLRQLSARDLGIPTTLSSESPSAGFDATSSLLPDDPVLKDVETLLRVFGGIIFTGPPGTSKSWYANAVGHALAGEPHRVVKVQFHPSYQYEDFMEGYVPDARGSFTIVDKTFVHLCKIAQSDPHNTYVLIIDELSRGDSGRVFGEALTYIEKSRRGQEVTLASQRRFTIPPNIVVLATMNPQDRGVDEVDAAFERRFAKIGMDPAPEVLRRRLLDNGVDLELTDRLVQWLRAANSAAVDNPQGAIGHAYFWHVNDIPSARLVWDYQLRFLIERAYALLPETRDRLTGDFQAILEQAGDGAGPDDEAESA